MQKPIFISVREMCQMLSIGKTQFYKLLAKGEIETVRIGSRRLVLLSSALAFAQRCVATSERAVSTVDQPSYPTTEPGPYLCHTHSSADSLHDAQTEQLANVHDNRSTESVPALFSVIEGGRDNG